MPDNRELQSNAVSTSSNSSPDNLEDAMWRLKIQGGPEGADADQNPYPDRPGEPNCLYYLRTGSCGYGNNCRYNHPTYTGQAAQYRGELPERVGQPECQYFLKTGTCKFGETCKYHHPRDKHDARPVSLNILGLPMRQDEKSCPYYMRTSSCKFGILCKFNHPQPATLGAAFPITGPSTYGSPGSSVGSPSGLPLIGGFSPWTLPRPPYMPSPRMPGLSAYMPIVLPPSQGSWSTYTMSNSKHLPQSGSNPLVNLPERPDQPECQYYMKTGSCKYGTTCKYHHPKERNSLAMFTLGPHGFPLRPGQVVCMFYSMYGSCKYGSTCKFDHPLVGYYNCSLPALSVLDPSAFFPNQTNSQAIWTSAETLPSKTSRSPNRLMKSVTSIGLLDSDSKEHDNLAQASSPSYTAPSSESPRDHSD